MNTAGLVALTRKEVSDSITSRASQLALGIFMITTILSSFTAGEAYMASLAWGPRDSLMIIPNLIPAISMAGALVAITLGFNTIKRESSEGSLKVLLSYPVYRDQVILGKYLGGLIVIAVAVAASLGISLAVYIETSGLIPDAGTLLNYSTFVMLSIILLSGYLGLSILLSLAFKDVKTTLLLLFSLLIIFNSEILYSIGLMTSNAVLGYSPTSFDILTAIALNPQAREFPQLLYIMPSTNPQAQAMREFIYGLSPTRGFVTASLPLMHRYRAILDFNIATSLTWLNVVSSNLLSIIALTVLPVVTFIGSYALFTRRDIA